MRWGSFWGRPCGADGSGLPASEQGGKLCVDTDRVEFTNYFCRTLGMELRQPAFAPDTRVLLVDQWIETGGTMEGAIQLVERQGGKVAGLVALAMETNPTTDSCRARFPCAMAVVPGSR